jgi:hypothetical protein
MIDWWATLLICKVTTVSKIHGFCLIVNYAYASVAFPLDQLSTEV